MKFICKQVSKEVFESKLLMTYLKLSKDNVWGVWRDAVVILPEISEISSNSIREN